MLSNFEKFKSERLYDYSDAELCQMRLAAGQLLREFNALPYSDLPQAGRQILGRLFKTMGTNLELSQPFNCDYGFNISWGNNCYANINLTILDCGRVSIGSGTLIGPNCSFYTVNHPLHWKGRLATVEYAKPIVIEDNVWIGGNVVILPGVTIGKGCVIGAGSVVTRSVPPMTLAAGNPCKVVREITDDDLKVKFRGEPIDYSGSFSVIV